MHPWYGSANISPPMASFNFLYHFIFVLSFTKFVNIKAQDHTISWYYNCPGNETAPNSDFQLNLKTLLSYLSSNATVNKQFYHNTTVTSTNHSDTVYGMFVCWGDLPPQLCSQCVASITQPLLSNKQPYCSESKSAVIPADDCMIRFSNSSFFSIPDLTSPTLSCRTDQVSNQTNFRSLFDKTSNEAVNEAANSFTGARKYATKQVAVSEFQTLYFQVQCTPDLSPHDCIKCLNLTQDEQICNGSSSGNYFNTSCYFKYQVYPFYYTSTAPSSLGLLPVTNYSIKDSQDAAYLSHSCSTSKTMITTNREFLSNLRTLLSSLSSKATIKTGFFNETQGTNPSNRVTGLFLCRGDLSPTQCEQCVQKATQRISLVCPSSKQAVIWYNHCLLRYSNGSSLSEDDISPAFHHFNFTNISNPNQQQSFFTGDLVNTLSKLEDETDDTGVRNYVAKSVKLGNNQTLYALAQCTQDISSYDCGRCLHNIFINEIPWCCLGSPEGKALYPSCYMMFGLSKFYEEGNQVEAYRPPIPPPKTAGNKISRSQAIILSVVLVILLVALISFCCYLRRRKERQISYKTLLKNNFGPESTTIEGLQFDLDIIKAATNNFSQENKIGKGGFGEVYKGILSDGRCIAVKRLSTRSKQGSIEFKNEILLIAKLQHKNLVTLIGFCLEELEKILIYEYMSNGSLDYLLFGTQLKKLTWSERYQIIRGTALGILYLHEHSRLKVIHRDLKPSNVLLDENMNPRISDFGMAKIIEMNQDCENTNRIVGTYGYMSPEYALFGQFSEKSDVFSFGVMVLEIITGKRNKSSYESHKVVEGLSSYVWRQWKDEIPLSILDSNLKESSSQIEVIRCIHIGLLCVQENPSVRPSMTTIISYLNNHSLELPFPQAPAFFLNNIVDQEIVTQQQDSTSDQVINDSIPLSINEMSISNFYPR